MTRNEKLVMELLDDFSPKVKGMTFCGIPIDDLNLSDDYWRKMLTIFNDQLKTTNENHESAMRMWELCRSRRLPNE